MEEEVRGYISKENFSEIMNSLKNKFGNLKEQKRLALTVADYDNLDLETKIRITDGKVDVTQKIGDFNALRREENTIKYKRNDAEFIYDLYKTYVNFIAKAERLMNIAIQHENYIIQAEEFEIKLFCQFGNGEEFFAFEVERLKDSEKDIYDFCKEVGLEVSDTYNNLDEILERNKKVNIQLAKLSKDKIIELIKNYL